jgi:hypothetical protein
MQGERLQLVGGLRPGASWSLLLNLRLYVCKSFCAEAQSGLSASGHGRVLEHPKRDAGCCGTGDCLVYLGLEAEAERRRVVVEDRLQGQAGT